MTSNPTDLLQKHQNTGIVVDTNILLVYCVGILNPKRIQTFKRTNTFTEEDFSILDSFLKHFKKIVTTPNILTEVSNLAGQLTGRTKQQFFQSFAKRIGLLHEYPSPSAKVSSMQEFVKIGLADSAIIKVCREQRFLVLTDDLTLFGFLQKEEIDVINFNHIRWLG